MKPAHHAEVAAIVFLGGVAFAVTHLVSGAHYGHFVHLHNVIIDVGLATIWSAAALASLVRRTFASFLAVVAGTAVAHIHGFLFSVAAPGTGAGVPFLIASSVLLPLLFTWSAPAWRTAAAAPERRRVSAHSLSRPSHA